MSSQRPSFAKRDREMKLKDKARAKAEKRAARKAARAAGIDPDAPETTDEAGLDGPNGATVTTATAPNMSPAPSPAPAAPAPPAPLATVPERPR